MPQKSNMLKIIGLMSGTSMDGINATFVKTDGITLNRFNISNISSYSSITMSMLVQALKKPEQILKNQTLRNELDYQVTVDHYKSVLPLIKQATFKPDLIGFHGQTLIHYPNKNISLQLGNGQILSNLLKIPVVSNFRNKDLEYGGQGAPISPIYHQSIIEEKKLALPSCFLNLGGVANITYWDGEQLIGFDTGPANGLMDMYMQKTFNKKYDNAGKLASEGNINYDILNHMLRDNYFKSPPPKSVDRQNFNYIYELINKKNYQHSDIMATLAEFTYLSIKASLKLLPQKIKNMVIMGGGVHNTHLLNKLKTLKEINVLAAKEIGIPGDFIEAELIAYLAGRNFFNLPFTFPTTTGVKMELCGGTRYLPK